ncbi:AraC family transcriptional activator of pobA [Rhodovulum iodosum]|uniref:AraC family transcriptional activator of pobA n=1 Tax=Rhodovulum iodosum TaxID=68291 RepID=A0ABV3XNR7_9RHOB|nr:helix-turn-helix domain-containing protein [Rhodovulum robiginosum]
MTRASGPGPIPAYALYGERGAFPDLLHCERVWERARVHGWRIAPHRHPDLHQVFVLQSGEAEMEVDGQARTLSLPCAVSVPRQVVHGFRFARGTEGLVLTVPVTEIAALTRDAPELAALAQAPAFVAATPALAAAMAAIHAERLGTGWARAPMLRALTLQALCLIGRAADSARRGTDPARARIAAFEALAQENLSEGWSVADYAQVLDISPTHLTRLCRQVTGQPPRAFLQGLLVQEAKRLLAYTALDVAEIGYRLGIEDPSYFSRLFKRHTGRSPRAFRAPYRGAGDPGNAPVPA